MKAAEQAKISPQEQQLLRLKDHLPLSLFFDDIVSHQPEWKIQYSGYESGDLIGHQCHQGQTNKQWKPLQKLL